MKKKIAQIIDNRYKFSRDQQSDIFDDFSRYRALWLSKISDPGGWPWDYTLFNPMVFTTLRSFVARTSTGSPGITLQAWNEEDRPKTRLNNDLLLWELQEADFQQKLAKAVFSCGLYGRSFLWDGWLFEKEKKIVEENENGGKKREFVVRPMINRADLGNLRTYDVFVANRNISDFQEQPWVIIRRWRTIAELKRINEMRGGEVYDEKQLDGLKDKNLFVRYVDYGRDVMYADNADIPFENGVLEILEMWDREEGTVHEKIRNESGETAMLREEDNPFYHDEYPITDVVFMPEEEEFWSQGLVRPMEDLQMALNATLNQYLSNARQHLNNMWINGDVRIPDWEFVSRPNGIIHTQGSIDQIKEVQHKDITQNAMSMMGELRTDIQRTTGINDYLAMGTPDKSKKGAAAMQMEETNLDQNLKLFMTFLEQQTIKKIAKHFLANNKQFITSEQTIKIAGRHGYRHVNIKEDDVSAGFDPIVIPNSAIPKNPMVRSQNLMNLKAMADKEQKVNVNTAPIWKELVSTMGLTDLDEIIPDDMDEALEENDLMEKGVDVEVEVRDNHKAHKIVHQFLLISKKLDKSVTERIVEHIKIHDMWELAQDPQLLQKLTGNPQVPQGQAAPPNPAVGNGAAPQATASPAFPGPAATSPQGLVQQQGQQIGQNMQPPAGVPIPNPGGGMQG